MSKWNGLSSDCSMCGFSPGDVVHYLAGDCPVLSGPLGSVLKNSLANLPSDLTGPVMSSLSEGPEEWASFIVDPSTNVHVLELSRDFGRRFIWPLFKLSRAYIWCMHSQRLKFVS